MMFYDWRDCVMSVLGTTRQWFPSAVVVTLGNRVVLYAVCLFVFIIATVYMWWMIGVNLKALNCLSWAGQRRRACLQGWPGGLRQSWWGWGQTCSAVMLSITSLPKVHAAADVPVEGCWGHCLVSQMLLWLLLCRSNVAIVVDCL